MSSLFLLFLLVLLLWWWSWPPLCTTKVILHPRLAFGATCSLSNSKSCRLLLSFGKGKRLLAERNQRLISSERSEQCVKLLMLLKYNTNDKETQECRYCFTHLVRHATLATEAKHAAELVIDWPHRGGAAVPSVSGLMVFCPAVARHRYRLGPHNRHLAAPLAQLAHSTGPCYEPGSHGAC